MKPARVRTPAGTLAGCEEWPGLLAELAHLVVEAERGGRVLQELREIARRPLWLKGDHLPGSARARHSLRRWLGVPTPREREAQTLGWLEARLFRTPRPLAAATLVRAGLVRYQLLVLAPLPVHRTLESALATPGEPLRARWLDELAREVARMHALHFVHRDLFLRNVLVCPAPAGGDRRELVFLDAWHGGAAAWRRGSDYDLACLMLDAVDLLSAEEQRRWLSLYLAERAHHSRPVDARALLGAASRRRAELVARLAAGARRRPPPRTREWDGLALLASIDTARAGGGLARRPD